MGETALGSICNAGPPRHGPNRQAERGTSDPALMAVRPAVGPDRYKLTFKKPSRRVSAPSRSSNNLAQLWASPPCHAPRWKRTGRGR
jgi:hypothetical protein